MEQVCIEKCIQWWMKVLNLEHWRIEHRVVPAAKMSHKHNLMEFRPTRARMHAMIYIREDVLTTYSRDEVQKLIVHELTHLIYDPLAEEHNAQVKFSMDEARAAEGQYRFTQVLEKAVEHTAQMLCRSLPMWADDNMDNN